MPEQLGHNVDIDPRLDTVTCGLRWRIVNLTPHMVVEGIEARVDIKVGPVAQQWAFGIGPKPNLAPKIVLVPTHREGLFLQTAVGCGLLPMDPSIGVGGDILEAVFHRLRVAPGRVVERLGQIMSWIAQGAEAQDIHAVDVVNDRHVGIELSFAPKRDVGQSAQFQIGFLIVAAVPIGEGLAAKKGSALLHRVKKLGIA